MGEWHVDVNTLTTTRQHPTTSHNKHHTTTTAITTGSRTLNTGDNAKVRVLLRVLAGLDLEAKLLHIRQRLGAPVEQRVGLPWQTAQLRTQERWCERGTTELVWEANSSSGQHATPPLFPLTPL